MEASLGTKVLVQGDLYFCSYSIQFYVFSYIVIHSVFPTIFQKSIVPILQPYVSGVLGTVRRELRDKAVNRRAALPPHLSMGPM